jgi:hypothetical protein
VPHFSSVPPIGYAANSPKRLKHRPRRIGWRRENLQHPKLPIFEIHAICKGPASINRCAQTIRFPFRDFAET